ncbi:hypothetical protein EST38_g9947 [Candolleomyces aberdarensis]|uniref:Uncharacterized protein n=1 Tax=Candolleomyces aberdarensis TaxID=2316362 RepID=A0A4V1Q2Q5_9AGAR|nr:hypothetical protein EST38_g9947 [Candolleomyces aberdarensis]
MVKPMLELSRPATVSQLVDLGPLPSPHARLSYPETRELTTEEHAYIDDVPPIWISEDAEIVPEPVPGKRTAMLTVDGEVVIDEPQDYEVSTRSPTPESIEADAVYAHESDSL